MDLVLYVQILLSGHMGEAIGEDGVVPLREYVSYHSILEDSTFPAIHKG